MAKLGGKGRYQGFAGVRLEGFDELEKNLGELPKAAGTRVLKNAGMKAMRPMAKLAKSLAPNDDETPPLDLASSITLSDWARVGTNALEDVEKGGRATIFMGPRFDLPRYARAIVMEFGSFKDQAQPYMRPAFDQDAAAVINRLVPLIRAEIDKVVARASARAAKSKG